MSLWIIETAIVVLGLYVFVWPFAFAQIKARILHDEAVEALGESLEDLFDNFGGRVGHFLVLTAIAGLIWLGWNYFKA